MADVRISRLAIGPRVAPEASRPSAVCARPREKCWPAGEAEDGERSARRIRESAATKQKKGSGLGLGKRRVINVVLRFHNTLPLRQKPPSCSSLFRRKL